MTSSASLDPGLRPAHHRGNAETIVRISVTEAQTRLTDLVDRAEAGDEVVLTRSSAPAVQLVALRRPFDPARRRAAIDKARKAGAKALPGPTAARSQDFLYGDDGLPE